MKQLLQKYNSRTLLNIGLFVFILLLVLLVVLEPGKQAEKKAVHLTGLTQAGIKHIELKRASEADIKLEKRDGIWFLTEPYQLPANDFRARSVSALAEAESHLQYDARTIEPKKFKLDKPDISIIFNNEVSLAIGGVDPLNNRRYVKSGDTLHLVSDTFYYQLTGAVTSYISYQILPPDIKLSKLVLPKFTLSQQDGNWQMTPAQKDTSADSINEFINEWRHAQSLEISEYKGALRKPNIHVYQAGAAGPISFSLQKQNDSTFLIRNDLRLRYKLSDETAEKLQNLPEPPQPAAPAEAEQTGSESKPSD